MNETTRILNRSNAPRRRQTGGITLFSGVLILILLTEVLVYAVQSGVFEQRKSANEYRQKQAFHVAESALQAGKSFFAAHAPLIAAGQNDILPDGTDGWLSANGKRWSLCSGADLSDETHPCNAENFVAWRGDIYFYDYNDSVTTDDKLLPIDTSQYSPGISNDRVELYALLCVLDIDRRADPVVQGCTTDPASQDRRYIMITLAARGQADCSGGTCTAEAMVTERLLSFGPATGGEGPAAPLTSKSTLPSEGDSEIVANPNGAGLGVPVSAWLSTNPLCSTGEVVDPYGASWTTCERHEWYGTMDMPADFKCPSQGGCRCAENERRLSYSPDGNTLFLNFDIVADTEFPCDLFQYTFGTSRSDYRDVKNLATVVPDCSSLDENSHGFYWITGYCLIESNLTIGSVHAPVFIVGAGPVTELKGGSDIFGLLLVTDVENAGAEFRSSGQNTVYGAVIVDGAIGEYTGTFQVVYLDYVLETATKSGMLSAVPGGWSDFHRDWR